MIPIKGQSENEELEDLRRKVREQEALIEAQRYEIEQRVKQDEFLRSRLSYVIAAASGKDEALVRLQARFQATEREIREEIRMEHEGRIWAEEQQAEVAELLGVGVDELLPTLRATKQSRDRMVASRLGRMMLRLARARYG